MPATKPDSTKTCGSGTCNGPSFSRAVTALALVGGVIAAITQVPDLPSLTGAPASTKPFRSFEEFYPFYLGEHSHPTCRLLHFIGTAIVMSILYKYPLTIISVLLAGSIGVVLSTVLQGLPHGLVEGGLLVAVFVLTNKFLKQCGYVTLSVLLIGYAFAWVGHFFFEKNKPATFIYPTYSLMGDFKMFFEILTGRISGIF